MAIKKHKIGVKCATITPDDQKVKELNLTKKYISPNVQIRNELKGTFFREAVRLENIKPYIKNWKNPIIIGRHAYGDQWKSAEVKIKKGKKLKLVYEEYDSESQNFSEPGQNMENSLNSKENIITKEIEVFDFDGKDGIAMLIFNTDDSIKSFAHSCFKYSLERKLPLYLSTKNTINQIYDENFKQIFEEIYSENYKKLFEELEIFYEHKLIDDMVAFVTKSSGGFIWAAKNHDGDVQSDFVVQGFGSLGLMTSVLMCSDGLFIYFLIFF